MITLPLTTAQLKGRRMSDGKTKKGDNEKESLKKNGGIPAKSRWDLDSYKAMEQRKGIYDWSRKDY